MKSNTISSPMLETIFNAVAAFFSNLAQSLLSLAKVLIRSRWSVQLPVPQQARCSVLGNGPSLNDSLANHLDFLLETELIVVNGFALTDYFTRLRPANYIIADPNAFTFHDATTGREDLHQILQALITQVDWRMRLFIPNFAKGSYFIQQIETGNPRIELIYFNPYHRSWIQLVLLLALYRESRHASGSDGHCYSAVSDDQPEVRRGFPVWC